VPAIWKKTQLRPRPFPPKQRKPTDGRPWAFGIPLVYFTQQGPFGQQSLSGQQIGVLTLLVSQQGPSGQHAPSGQQLAAAQHGDPGKQHSAPGKQQSLWAAVVAVAQQLFVTQHSPVSQQGKPASQHAAPG